MSGNKRGRKGMPFCRNAECVWDLFSRTKSHAMQRNNIIRPLCIICAKKHIITKIYQKEEFAVGVCYCEKSEYKRKGVSSERNKEKLDGWRRVQGFRIAEALLKIEIAKYVYSCSSRM